MKKCIVCGKEVRKLKRHCCENCLDFLKWKYGSDYYPSIMIFRWFEKERFKLTKARRYKK
jgi:hypothetical protein